MTKLISKEDVKIIQFYQMPKVFFGDTKYAAMRNESKIAYMLLQDLLPLSIQNNWVNDKGEVFVKLSRKNLMSLLNIKGTQKIAQVMKELVELNLIIYKKVGLSKCNEIYICLPTIDEPTNKNDPPTSLDSKEYEKQPSANIKINSTETPKTNITPCEIQTHINTNSIKTNYTKTNITQSINQERETPTERKMDLNQNMMRILFTRSSTIFAICIFIKPHKKSTRIPLIPFPPARVFPTPPQHYHKFSPRKKLA